MRLNEIDFLSPEMYRGREFWGLSGGAIAFDYGDSLEKMGLGLEESDAVRAIEFIKSRFPFV